MVLPDFLREGRDGEIKAKYWIIIQEGYPQSSGTTGPRSLSHVDNTRKEKPEMLTG